MAGQFPTSTGARDHQPQEASDGTTATALAHLNPSLCGEPEADDSGHLLLIPIAFHPIPNPGREGATQDGIEQR